MENIIYKYAEENWPKYISLGHALEDRLKITFEGPQFTTLLSISLTSLSDTP